MCKQEKQPPEIVSVKAMDGKFFPFTNDSLSEHLGLKLLDGVHVFHMPTGSWITILRSSPPLSVTQNSTFHFKPLTVAISVEKIVDYGIPKRENSNLISDCSNDLETKEESVDGEMSKKHSSGAKTSPVVTVPDSPSVPRPASLSIFPANLAIDMHNRFQWIIGTEAGGCVSERFALVYSCKFVASTYFRHLACWRRLKQSGTFDRISETALWKDYYVGGTKNPIKVEDFDASPLSLQRHVRKKANPSDTVIDLTTGD